MPDHPTLSKDTLDQRRTRRRQNLKRLLNARPVAFVGGASAAGGIRYCRALGFRGDIWAVNPTRSELEGVRCVPRIAELPGVPDATWIAVPATSAIETVRELNQIGAPSAVCYAAGFSESGDHELENQLISAAGDMAIVGPNCIGAVNYLDGIPVAIAPELGIDRPAHGVALVAQSGTIIGNMTSSQRSLPVSHLLSMGNQSILDLADGIDAVTDDPRVDAILLYLEGIKDARAFAQAVSRAFENGKVLIALKGGTSQTGRTLALSHTGSLAGSTAFLSCSK
jgi:acyl-CoA synthetase (NDP forming)